MVVVVSGPYSVHQHALAQFGARLLRHLTPPVGEQRGRVSGRYRNFSA
jgi:hypothetical protein